MKSRGPLTYLRFWSFSERSDGAPAGCGLAPRAPDDAPCLTFRYLPA